jgi:SAM-dependent methyltransferase
MQKDEKKEKRNQKLKDLLLKRGDVVGLSYIINLKEDRNIELSEFLGRYVDCGSLKNKRVLDVGCGAGAFLSYLQENVAVGMDKDKEIARAAFAKDIVIGDAHALPFRNESFDLVLNFDVIEHVRNQGEAIENMMAKIRGNGTLILLTNNRLFPFDSDTKLFFINYLPKIMADRYLRFRRKRSDIEYDVKCPTYFTFSRLCGKRKGYEISTKGVFTVFGFYVKTYVQLKKFASFLEKVIYKWRILEFAQWFAPKLALIIKKVQ